MRPVLPAGMTKAFADFAQPNRECTIVATWRNGTREYYVGTILHCSASAVKVSLKVYDFEKSENRSVGNVVVPREAIEMWAEPYDQVGFMDMEADARGYVNKAAELKYKNR